MGTANDRLTKAEAAWRQAEGGRLDIEGPKDTSPWGLLSWAISTGLLAVLNEKRKREAKAVLDEAKRESREVVARQDGAPFVGTAGRLEPEARLTDAPSRIDALEAALDGARARPAHRRGAARARAQRRRDRGAAAQRRGRVSSGESALRAYVAGVALWSAATGMQSVLFSWLVVGELGAAPEVVGLVQMAHVAPLLVLLLVGGAVADRIDRRRLLMALCAAVMFLTAPKWWMAATGSTIMAGVALWLWRRPEPRQ